MIDVLELMKPSTAELNICGSTAAAESLSFLGWVAFDSILTKCLTSLLLLQVSEAIKLIGEANQIAVGLPASVSANEGLAAFCVLSKLNELRYIDPALLTPPKREEAGKRELENDSLVEMVATLATRFSMDEIENMTPEFALLCWQRIREEVAAARNVIFYSTEFGYKKRAVGKKKYKLVSKKSPYTPFWVRQRERLGRPAPVVPRLVSHPEKVIDGMSGKQLAELGEISV